MKATEVLMSEHRIIERMITSLNKAVNALEAGKDVPAQFFLDTSNFIRGFADGCHHKKEEGVLFKAMAHNGMPESTGPLAMMRSEHEKGRTFNRGILTAAQKMIAGDKAAVREVILNARGYTSLLTQHIAKEDQMLFSMADQIIPVSQQDAVMEDFEHVEHEEIGDGVHEKYLALVDTLEKEISRF